MGPGPKPRAALIPRVTSRSYPRIKPTSVYEFDEQLITGTVLPSEETPDVIVGARLPTEAEPQVITARAAPPVVQPVTGGTAQAPNTLATAGQTQVPPAQSAATQGEPVPETTPENRAKMLAATSYSEVQGGNYTDPYEENGNLVNKYQLQFYENYPNTKQDKYDAVELPYVQRVTMQAPNAVSRTRSMSGEVYAEHQGFIQRTFVIEGRSGPVWNADGGDTLTIHRFTKLRNFLELYGNTSANNKNALVRYKNTQLILNCTFESEAHFCEVVNFNYKRSADTSTYSFEYSITLVTNGPTGRKFNSSVLSGGTGAPKWKWAQPSGELFKVLPTVQTEESLESQFFDRLVNVNVASLIRARDFELRLRQEEVALKQAPTLQNMRCSDIQEMRVNISTANSVLDTILFTDTSLLSARTAAKTSLAWTSYALDIAHSIKGASNIACPVPPWSDLYYQLVPYAVAGTVFVQYLASLFGNNRGYDYTYSVTNTPPVRLGLVATANTGPERPFAAVNYFLPDNGADAYSIAANVLGDANQYWRIMDLNNFRDAYTRADGTPLSPGSSVLIPSTTAPAARDTDVFGTDLLIVNGDLQLVGNNDVMRISGYANYTQNLMHRMKTPRGTNRVFPNHGLMADIHSSANSTLPALIRTDVRDQVLQDHRTDEVRELALTELGDKVQVSMVVKAIAGTQRNFKFNYDLNSQVTA